MEKIFLGSKKSYDQFHEIIQNSTEFTISFRPEEWPRDKEAVFVIDWASFNNRKQLVAILKELTPFIYIILVEENQVPEEVEDLPFSLVFTDWKKQGKELSHNLTSAIEFSLHRSKEIETVKSELDQMLPDFLKELKRVKSLYEKFVPIRTETFNNYSLLFKFAVGEGPGGEFFDRYKKDNLQTFIFTHTDSYKTSSQIMGLVEKYLVVNRKPFFQAEEFLEDLKNYDKENAPIGEDLQFLVFTVDSTNMKLKGFCRGNFQFIETRQGLGLNIDGSEDKKSLRPFEGQLMPGEKLVICSPGIHEAMNNGDQDAKSLDVRQFLGHPSKDLITEVFYALKKNLEGAFMKKDMSLACIEVEQNAKIQV